jgi:hypothetical protein
MCGPMSREAGLSGRLGSLPNRRFLGVNPRSALNHPQRIAGVAIVRELVIRLCLDTIGELQRWVWPLLSLRIDENPVEGR